MKEKSFWACLAIFLLKLCLKLIASEASEEKIEKISVLGIKKPYPLVRIEQKTTKIHNLTHSSFDNSLLIL